VVAGTDADGSPCVVDLDLSADYQLDGRRFYSGAEVLAGRRRQGEVWVPARPVEFGCTLVRRVAKGTLADDHARRLTDLYRQDPAGCREQVARFWRADATAVIAAAAESGDWEPVRRDLPRLRAALMQRVTLQHPVRFVGYHLSRFVRRFKRYVRPDGGVGVVFLGPDGAGKSSVIAGVRRDLAGVFPTSDCLSFP